MENFKELYCNESLLDDLDTMMSQADKSDKEMIYADIVKNYPINKPGYDAYGRKLEVGDWVIYKCWYGKISFTPRTRCCNENYP